MQILSIKSGWHVSNTFMYVLHGLSILLGSLGVEVIFVGGHGGPKKNKH